MAHAMCRFAPLRRCRPLVVLVSLVLSACPFNFKYHVENGPATIAAPGGRNGTVALASAMPADFPLVAERSRR